MSIAFSLSPAHVALLDAYHLGWTFDGDAGLSLQIA
jgi:hypothetical protein